MRFGEQCSDYRIAARHANFGSMRVGVLRLKELWRGQLPLEVAFWHHAILYVLLFNVLASAAALALIVLEAPIAVALIVHLLPVPYSVIAICGVWRSAACYTGRQGFAAFARIASLAWCGFWLAA